MTSIELDDLDRERLAGGHGKAEQLAMRMLVAAAETSGATDFVPIEFAHMGRAITPVDSRSTTPSFSSPRERRSPCPHTRMRA